MTINQRRLAAAAALVFLSASANAEFAINPRVGTLGLGIEVSKGFGERWSVALGFNTYDYSDSDTIDQIDYDVNLDLQTIGVFASFHPFAGALRVTGGLLSNGNELALRAKLIPGQTYQIGSANYVAQAGDGLAGKVDFRGAAPYIGIGWGNRPGSKLGVSFDVGVLYQGSPSVTLTPSGNLTTIANEVEAERRQAEADLKDFKWYPVVALGLYIGF